MLVEAPRGGGIGKQGLDLAREREPPAGGPIEQWLLSHAVPAEHQAASALVPYRKREHAVQTLRELHRVELLGQVRDHLCVAARAEGVATTLQTRAQLAEVVDLTVEDGGNGLVLVRDRRIASLEVDDREPVLGDDRALRREASAGVRAAMGQSPQLCVHHGLDVAGLGPDESTDTAHQAAAGLGALAGIARASLALVCGIRRSPCARHAPDQRRRSAPLLPAHRRPRRPRGLRRTAGDGRAGRGSAGGRQPHGT